jgi:hypothetical protein
VPPGFEDDALYEMHNSLRITVEVGSAQNVIDAAKFETQRKFGTGDDESETRDQPFIDEHFGQALAILLASDAVTGSLTGILERTVAGLRVTGMGVFTSEVQGPPAD